MLVKLKIEGFEEPTCSGIAKEVIYAFLNPSSYNRSYNALYSDQKSIGASDSTQVFNGIGQSDLNLSFFVDGTGIRPLPGKYADVDAYISHFAEIVHGYRGHIHRPYYLLVTWGNLKVIGICSKMEVKYNLFNPEGKALRATIDITITESKDYKTLSKEAARSSPDLTHRRIVRAGDTLPLMAFRIYGSSGHHQFVAEHNKLNSFYALKPGDSIDFPPIEK